MNRLNQLALVAATTATLGAAAITTAYAGQTMQGPQLSGIALQVLKSKQPAVTVVTLPTGETVDLRSQATD